MEKQFKIKNLIGKGTFGSVYKAEDGLGLTVAVKKIATRGMDSQALSLLKQEVNVMSSISHPNTVELKFSFETADSMYMIMEYCEGGDLESYMKDNPNTSILYLRKWITSLLQTLKYLHSNNIIHRDLKLANFLLTSKDPAKAVVKIADFGFAKVMAQNITSTQLGSPLYMAPEIFRCNNYTIKADIWSMGTVIYELLVGKSLFKCMNLTELIRKQAQPLKIPGDCKLSEEAIDVITNMLVKDPERRPSCEELLEFTFFQEGSEEKCREMEKIQDQYLFVSDSLEEEVKCEEVQDTGIENSEYFDEPDTNYFDIFSAEMSFFAIEELISLLQSDLYLPLHNYVTYYLSYAIPKMQTDIESLSERFKKVQIFAHVFADFHSKLIKLTTEFTNFSHGVLEIPDLEYIKDLETLISTLPKSKSYILSLVKHFILN